MKLLSFLRLKGVIALSFFCTSWVWAMPAGVVKVHNETGQALKSLYISPIDTEWTEELLGEDTLAANNTKIISLRSYGDVCTFDLKAVDEKDNIYYIWEFNACLQDEVLITPSARTEQNTSEVDIIVEQAEVLGDEGDFTPPNINIPESQRRTLQNKLDETIFYVFVRKAGTTEWSKDIMETAQVIGVEDETHVAIVALDEGVCTFDLKATDLNASKAFVLRNVNLCENEVVAFTPDTKDDNEASVIASPDFVTEEDHTEGDDDLDADTDDTLEGNLITVENKHRKTVFYLYIRPANGNTWGDDRLDAGNALSSGESASVFLPEIKDGQCEFEIRGTDLDDKEVVFIARHNFCELPFLTLK